MIGYSRLDAWPDEQDLDEDTKPGEEVYDNYDYAYSE